MNDVFPSRDADFDDFQRDLYATCSQNALAWQIAPNELSDLVPFKTEWEAKWAIASNKANRTPVETRLKDLARAAYETVLRPFIKGLYINPAMNVADIEACGLKPHDEQRHPLPVPTNAPLVLTLPENSNMVKFIIKQVDAEGNVKRAKPKGAAFCQLVYSVEAVPANPSECPNSLHASRGSLLVGFLPEQQAKKGYFFSRWVMPSGETSPWSQRQEFLIP